MKKEIKNNKAKCLLCGDIIESKHRHDFVECSCGNLYVDGGLDYLRRGFKENDSWEDLSEYIENTPEEEENHAEALQDVR